MAAERPRDEPPGQPRLVSRQTEPAAGRVGSIELLGRRMGIRSCEVGDPVRKIRFPEGTSEVKSRDEIDDGWDAEDLEVKLERSQIIPHDDVQERRDGTGDEE